ncbi:MAG: SET domain-containing protein [Candidatus Woesearchaeota archaeon]
MFHVKIYLDKSKLHGMGLFSEQNIKKGALIYSHNFMIDLLLGQKQLDSLKKKERDFVMHHGYFDKKKKKWYLSHDNIRFCNHSSKPNMKSKGKHVFAIKDIVKGEELTQDYRDFENPIRNSRNIKL